MKVYELMERLSGEAAGADVFACGERIKSACVELLAVMKNPLDGSIQIFIEGTTQGNLEVLDDN